ncbi:MAG TPA: SIMPL domain-containing protein [Candidatus Paceibacterota bacterium]
MDQLSLAKAKFFQSISMFMWILCLVAIATFVLLWKAGQVTDSADRKTISVEGKAERFVAPDIATLSFGVSEEAKTVREAQAKATDKINKAIHSLDEFDVEEKDIKTTNYNIQPKYEYYYEKQGVRCLHDYCPPPYVYKTKIMGYTVDQNVHVKLRDLNKAGEVIAKLGSFGIGNISSLSFETENIDSVREEVKNEAIRDARAKAKSRADVLDVRLGKLLSVSDNYWGGPYYARDAMMESKVMMADNVGGNAAPAPDLPAGENQIIATVNLVYEID